ncbi:MAG TPA: hypothetical protein VLE95_05625 [Chlamydiales bacterium]|nr:hypothetical protein [Chlamydiales bacterium]
MLLILAPFVLQALAIGFDEIWFHLRRGLPLWERIGHPIDTLTVFICMGFILFVPYSKAAIPYYAFLAIFSCLMVTKDEFIHKHVCPVSENWLHALLFLLHPITLGAAGLIWPAAQGIDAGFWTSFLSPYKNELRLFLICQFTVMGLFMVYQTIYWNFIYIPKVIQESAFRRD